MIEEGLGPLWVVVKPCFNLFSVKRQFGKLRGSLHI
jgi:hypothetical protein